MSKTKRYGPGLYQRVLAGSSTPFERVSTMYIGALRLSREGRDAVAAGQPTQAKERAVHVATLLRRLDVCLDHGVAPDLSTNLSRLYQHMQARLDQAEAISDPAIFDEVIAILDKLWDGFQSAEKSSYP